MTVQLLPTPPAFHVRLADAPSLGVTVQNSNGSGNAAFIERALPVTEEGQTQFNIFTQPTGGHWLVINGLTYRTPWYNIATVGQNVRLVWGGAFPLSTTDELFFVTF